MLGTSARIGEVLAIRLADLDAPMPMGPYRWDDRQTQGRTYTSTGSSDVEVVMEKI